MTFSHRFRIGVLGWMAGAMLTASSVWGNSTGTTADPPAEKTEPKLVARLSGFPEWVTSLAWSPDGHTLAAGSYETIRFWAPDSKEPESSLSVKNGFIKGLVFSRDGKFLAVGGYQLITLWDAATRVEKGRLEGHQGQVTGLAFSPNGQQLVTSSEDGTVRVWNVEDSKPQLVLSGHRYPVNGVAVSPDGSLIASAAGDETRVTRRGEVKLWDAATGKEIASFDHPAKAATAVAFSPDGKLLASTGFDEKVIVYDVVERKPLGEFDAHTRPTNCVTFADDNRTVISGSGGRAQGGQNVLIWDCVTGEEKATITEHEARISTLALSPDGKILATGSYDKTVALWDVHEILGTGTKSPAVEAGGTAVAKGNDVTQTAKADEKVAEQESPIRVGIIGLDTSHAIAFTKALNDPNAPPEIAGFRVVAAYPKGSPDIESSTSRVPMYTETVQKDGVEIVDSIDALLDKVDVVLLETNDGRPHLEQALQVMKKGKRVFIDKPVAGSLTDAVAIYEAAKKYQVPVFSSSSLRYGKNTQEVRAGKVGKVLGAETYSPCSLESTHPDLFWYGIHGVESLFTVMGTGCTSVRRTVSTEDEDIVVGTWKEGRTGTFHGYRKGKGGYGGTVEGEKGKAEVGESSGYGPLIVEIAKFFRTGEPPVSAEETLEIYAFMEAADESKRQNGAEVTLESVMAKARAEAAKKLADGLGANLSPAADNELTTEEKTAGWQLLFNGEDHTGWKCNTGESIASPIEEGSLVPHKSGGYLIIHEKQFGDFVLKCDVKMDTECNSGVFFRVGNPKDPVQTGFEVQVSSDKGAGYHDFGSIYDLVKPTKNNAKPAGQWNSIRITCKGPHISVEVNGEQVSEIDCDEWTEPGRGPDARKNKFSQAVKDFPRKGFLGFQDHGHKVWFKNVKVLELNGP